MQKQLAAYRDTITVFAIAQPVLLSSGCLLIVLEHREPSVDVDFSEVVFQTNGDK
jgi:hypothetical protein